MKTISEIQKKLAQHRLPLPMFVLDELEERDNKIKEVLAALEETQQQLSEKTGQVEYHQSQISRNYEMLDEKRKQLAEAQQTIARKQLYIEKLELSRESAQKAADNISKEKGLELFEARQTIARQREALKFYADKKTWNKPGVDQSGMALAALGEGAKES